MTQIVAVGVCSTDQDTVFLHDSEAGCCFPCTGESSLPALGAEGSQHRGTFCRNAGAAGEDVQSDALAEEDFPDGAADGRAVLDGVQRKGLTLLNMPFNSRVKSKILV